MRHVDEGTLHELIDGSLPVLARTQVEEHLGRCPACRDRLSDARKLVHLTAGLVAALDGAPTTVRHPPARQARRWYTDRRILGWAASLVAAIGIGFAARPFLRTAPPPASPASARVLMERSAASGVTGTSTPSARKEAPAAADGRRITLEEALHHLGGSIRLIDGLEPIEVEQAPGTTLPAGDPSRDAIVVRYHDPHLGVVELAQQRLAATPEPRRALAPAPSAGTAGGVSWYDGQGFHLVLRGQAPPESLLALKPRVH